MPQQIVDGKTLNEWCDSPYGAFAKAVRDSGLDPLFGKFEPRDDETKQSYEVTIQYSYSGTETVSYEVEAFNIDEARELAEVRFQKDRTLEGEDQEHEQTYEPKLI